MSKSTFLAGSSGIAATVALAILGAWLLWSHTGHLLLAVPYLLLLACPLVHVFHRGHRHTNSGAGTTAVDEINPKQEMQS